MLKIILKKSSSNFLNVLYREDPWKQSILVCAVDQLCLTLCNQMDCSSLGSSVHEVLQERILEWVASPFFRGIFLTQGWNPLSLASPALASGFFIISTTWVSGEKATICILFSHILSEMLLPAQSLPCYIWPWLNVVVCLFVFFSLLLKNNLQLWKRKR